MTHPTLGYTNFRFDGDDAVHMAAFNGAGHVIACNAEGPTEHDLWPHGVDAPVDCENCLRAREADWWMAQTEQQRREGAEAIWPETTSDELHNVAARVMSQVDAKVETAILWGDGDNAPPITVQTSRDYFFGQDKMAIKARQGDQKTYRTVDHVSQRSPEELNEVVAATLHQLDRERVPEFDEASPSIVDDPDAMRLLAERLKDPVQDAVKVIHVANPGSFLGEAIDRHDRETKQARYLARSPLSHLASDAGKSGAPEEILFEPPSMRDVYEVARAEREQGYPDREEPPEVPPIRDYENCDRCNYDTHRCPGCGEPLTHGTEVCAECNVRLTEEALALPEPANWCHVHNRTTEAGREECSECDGERGEDRKAEES